MSHKNEIIYKVFVYLDAYSHNSKCIKTERSYDKANNFLSHYLRENPEVSRAYIEKACSYRNNKREQWK